MFVKDAGCPIGILNFLSESSYNGATTKAIFSFKRRSHNATSKDKKSISVPEMGRILGLGKVESYWLVKKNYFTTIQVAGRMRVMLDSFEDWYAGQFHYKKVDGTPPGAKWRHTTMSVPELAELLGLKSATAYDLVKRAHLETMIIDRRIRVVNDSFESWYAGQNHYIKITERSC